MNGYLNTDSWYPVLLTSSSDFTTPISDEIFTDITCEFCKGGANRLQTLPMTIDNWIEAGGGKYSIQMGLHEWTDLANYQVSIACAGCVTYNFIVTVNAGLLAGNIMVIIHLQDINGSSISNGYIQVFDTTLTKLQIVGATDNNGNLYCTLEPGNYSLLISKQGVYSFATPETMTITNNSTITFVGTPIPSIPPAINCQLIYLYPIDVSNNITTKAHIYMEPQNEQEEIDPYFLVNTKTMMLYIPERSRFEINIIKGSNIKVDGKTDGAQFLYGEGQIDDNDTKNLVDYDWITS